MPPILHCHNVIKSYQRRAVLQSLNLQMQQGEFLGLVGANGAGKTTLIKSILDFCEIEQGEIKLLDVPHTDARARENLVFLPELFKPPYYLQGGEFLNYFAKLHQVTYQNKYAQHLCEQLDLEPTALTQLVRTYSKGMTQKLGLIACFLVAKPLLILDEPMSGLDPKARAYLKHYLLKLKTQRQYSLFFSSHLLADVEALCDRLAILHEGKIQFIGSPTECCQQFAADNLETAYLRCIGVKEMIGMREASI